MKILSYIFIVILGILLLRCNTSKTIYFNILTTLPKKDSIIQINFSKSQDTTTLFVVSNIKTDLHITSDSVSWIKIIQDTMPSQLIRLRIKVDSNTSSFPRCAWGNIGKQRICIIQNADVNIINFHHYNLTTTFVDIVLKKDSSFTLYQLPINHGKIIYTTDKIDIFHYKIVSAVFKNKNNIPVDWWDYLTGVPIGQTINIQDTLFHFAGGNGLPLSPFLIANPLQLNNVRCYGCNKNYITCFKQIKDIDLSDAIGIKGGRINNSIYLAYQNINAVFFNQESGWKPIGDNTFPFTGYYNGNHFSINGLCIQNRLSTQIGLFGKINPTALIENLTIKENSYLFNCYKYSDQDTIPFANMGAIAGENSGTINNCISYANLYSNNENNTGGIAGFNYGIITNSYTKNVYINSYIAGGIAGYNYGDVGNCYVDSNHINGNIIGGISGYNSNLISGCSSRHNVMIANSNGGDISGYNSNNIVASYAVDNYFSVIDSSAMVGGISGYNNFSGNITGCYDLNANMLIVINNNVQNNITKHQDTTYLPTSDILWHELNKISYNKFRFYNPKGLLFSNAIIWKKRAQHYPILWWE